MRSSHILFRTAALLRSCPAAHIFRWKSHSNSLQMLNHQIQRKYSILCLSCVSTNGSDTPQCSEAKQDEEKFSWSLCPAEPHLRLCLICETVRHIMLLCSVLCVLLLSSVLHPCWSTVLGLRIELNHRTPGTRPKGHWSVKACLLPCCGRVLVEDQEVVVAAAAAVTVAAVEEVEPNSLWVFPDYLVLVWV